MRTLLCLIFIIWQMGAQAGMPVIDAAAIAKIMVMIEKLNQQYQHMEKDFLESQMQTGVLSEQLSSIMGIYPLGDIYNTTDDKAARVWAPDTVEAFEEMLRYGFNPGDLADRYAYYQEKFPPVNSSSIDPKNPNSAHRDLYTYNEEWTKLNLVGFAKTFDSINASYEKVNRLLSEVNKQQTLKESSDFTNRLLGELAYLLQAMIQIQNFDLHVKTMLQQAEQNGIASHADFFTFKRR